ncbi:hypothetical protein PBI_CLOVERMINNIE_54 [Gordonia phage CloverMinnie]|nr:hypothetical protein PBI_CLOVERMINNIE_54 [Gordonia phage CloverMinnie]
MTVTPDTLADLLTGSAQTSICENCGGPTIEHGRNAIHVNGQYTCPPGIEGFAAPLIDFEPGEWHEKSYEAGHSDGYEAGRDDANDERHEEQYTQDDLDDAQAEARGEALEDALREIQGLIDRDKAGR